MGGARGGRAVPARRHGEVRNGPYVTNGDYTTNPTDQQANGLGAAGGTMIYKVKVQNDGTKRDRLIVKGCSNSQLGIKCFRGDNNITAKLKSADGYQTPRLAKNEFVIRARVQVPEDETPTILAIVFTTESKTAPAVDEDAVRARVEIVDV